MTRIRILFILGFLLSLGAGMVVGMVVGRAGADTNPTVIPPAPTHNRDRNPMDVDLALSPQQAEAVHKIWADVGAAMRKADSERFDRRHALSKERDDAILGLVPPDKKADYDRIQQEHTAKVAELNKERDAIVQEAEQKMKAVLTDAQWKRFEEIKKEHMEHGRDGRGPRPPGMPGHGPPPPFMPATRGDAREHSH